MRLLLLDALGPATSSDILDNKKSGQMRARWQTGWLCLPSVRGGGSSCPRTAPVAAAPAWLCLCEKGVRRGQAGYQERLMCRVVLASWVGGSLGGSSRTQDEMDNSDKHPARGDKEEHNDERGQDHRCHYYHHHHLSSHHQ